MKILPPTNLETCRKVREGFESTAFLNVWEGAVRSGKTVFALMAFANYVTSSDETSFLLSGRTVKTIEKNAILDEYGLMNLIPGAEYRKVGESRAIVFRAHGQTKTITVVGASDIRAYMQIRGNTYSGWFADEINMHDKEFVAEALRRTAMSHDRRHYWTLNPGAPQHWVYTDYLDRYDAMSEEELDDLGGYHWWLYTPKDNPAMTPKMIRSLEMQYPKGTYLYDRYILGLRCVAEGLVYHNIGPAHFIEFDRKLVDCRYAAIDFGTNHPTVMYIGGMFNGDRNDWRLCYEYYDKGSGKDTADYAQDFIDLCEENGLDPYAIDIRIDPAAGALKNSFRKRGLRVFNAKNDVLNGINLTQVYLNQFRLRFHKSCKHARVEFGTYAWDEKATERGEDKPVQIDDDCMDTIRYFAYSIMKPLVR